MNEPSELDLAQLRHEFRELYKHIGYTSSLQVLYEMMHGASTFAEVIMEEHTKEGGNL